MSNLFSIQLSHSQRTRRLVPTSILFLIQLVVRKMYVRSSTSLPQTTDISHIESIRTKNAIFLQSDGVRNSRAFKELQLHTF